MILLNVVGGYAMRRNRLITVLIALVSGSALLMTSCGSKVTVPDEYNYDLAEYISLGEYKGLSYEKGDTSVGRGDIEEYIRSVLEQEKTTETLKEGTVTDSSIVDIDYEGYIDGVQFEGGTGQTTLDIDNSNFIDGFAEALIGHEVGETFDINVVFPSDYADEEVAGKPAVFTITINSLQEDVIPEYNDDFVRRNTDFNNMKEYEADIKKNLEHEKKLENEKNARLEVFEKIVNASKVLKTPEKEYQARYDNIVSSYTSAAGSGEDALEKYLKNSMGMTLDEFYAQAEKSAKSTVKNELVLHAIAEEEGIAISDKEYEEYLDNLIKDAGYTADTFKSETGSSIEEYAEANNLYTSCLYQKVMDKVMSYCKE